MSHILYIGKYYPLLSYQSKQTEVVVKNLLKRGHKITLLSLAWCEVSENHFYGNVEDLSQNYPFYKKYYLDPIEIKFSHNNILNAYLGLACKILEYEDIDEIIFADDMQYSLIVEILKARYNKPTYLLLFDIPKLKMLIQNYMIPYMPSHLKIYDKIFTYTIGKEFLKTFLKIQGKNIISTIPFEIENIESFDKNKVLYVCQTTKNIADDNSILNKTIKNFLSLNSNFQLIKGDLTDCCRLKDLKGSNNVLILREEEMQVNSLIDYSYVLTSCFNGYYPLINAQHLELLSDFEIKFYKIGDLYVVTYLKTTIKTVAEYF